LAAGAFHGINEQRPPKKSKNLPYYIFGNGFPDLGKIPTALEAIRATFSVQAISEYPKKKDGYKAIFFLTLSHALPSGFNSSNSIQFTRKTHEKNSEPAGVEGTLTLTVNWFNVWFELNNRPTNLSGAHMFSPSTNLKTGLLTIIAPVLESETLRISLTACDGVR
jgi:hypothetical protein